MKIFKVDDNYLDFILPRTLASQVGIKDIYFSDTNKKNKMFAIINMVSKTEENNEILSFNWDSITINTKLNYTNIKVYNYGNYLLLGNYLFEIHNYNDVKMARRYYKLIKLRNKL